MAPSYRDKKKGKRAISGTRKRKKGTPCDLTKKKEVPGGGFGGKKKFPVKRKEKKKKELNQSQCL